MDVGFWPPRVDPAEAEVSAAEPPQPQKLKVGKGLWASFNEYHSEIVDVSGVPSESPQAATVADNSLLGRVKTLQDGVSSEFPDYNPGLKLLAMDQFTCEGSAIKWHPQPRFESPALEWSPTRSGGVRLQAVRKTMSFGVSTLGMPNRSS